MATVLLSDKLKTLNQLYIPVTLIAY